MLRAARRLIFESPKLKSYSGLLLSPCININGLIVRADRSMEEQRPIKDFLNAKGAVVHRFKINNELYIGIYGQAFQLCAKEIKEFLDQNKVLSTRQTEHLDEIPAANNLVNTLNGEYYEHVQSTVVKYTDGNEVIMIPPEISIISKDNIEIDYNQAKITESSYIETVNPHNTIVSSQNIDAICDDLTRTDGHMVAGENISILTNSMMCSSKIMLFDFCTQQEIEQILVGLMSTHMSLNNTSIICRQPAKLANTVISAANTVTFRGSAELSIDTNISWLNNPYRQLLPMFKDRNNIRRLQTNNPTGEQSTANYGKLTICP